MKTTIEISDMLMREMKELAGQRKTTMRNVIETALRLYLDKQKNAVQEYHFKNHSFKGQGVCEGVQEGDWNYIRNTIYEGRGG